MNLLTRVRNRRGVRQFIKFGIIGASGLAVNLVIFTLLQHVVPNHNRAPEFYVISSIGFLCGGISNYFLNRIWTFRSRGHAAKEGAQFLTVSVVALLVNLGVSALVHPYLGLGHRTWFVAIVASTFVNFFANKYWTFKDAPR